MREPGSEVVVILNKKGARVMPLKLKKELSRKLMEDAGRKYGRMGAFVGKHSYSLELWLQPWIAIVLLILDIICALRTGYGVWKYGWDWMFIFGCVWIFCLNLALAIIWVGRKGLSHYSEERFSYLSAVPPILFRWASSALSELPEGATLCIEHYGDLGFLTIFGPSRSAETTFACWKDNDIIWSPSSGLALSKVVAKT